MSSGSGRGLADLSARAMRRLKRLALHARSRVENAAHAFDKSPSAPLFIHFGTRKTGSSSIQNTLYENRGRSFGYHYPDLGQANGSMAISTLFCSAETLVARRLAPSLEVAETRKAERGKQLASLLAAGPRKLPKVLSAETITDLNSVELAALDQYVSKYWPDRIYLGYIREPVSFLRSAYQETLKLSNPRVHVIDADAPLRSLAVRTHEFVNQLDTLVGRDRVRVFAFDRGSFPDGDVVRHFLQQIGARDDGIQIHHANDSMSLLAVKLLYLYRTRKIQHDGDLASPRSRKAFLSAVSDLGSARFELHPSLVARMVEANRPFYEWSARRLDRTVLPPTERHEDGVSGLADLERLSADEVAAFSDQLQRFGLSLPANPDGDAIAESMHALRMAFAAGPAARRGESVSASPKQGTAQNSPVAPAPVRGAEVVLLAAKPKLFLHIGMGKTGTTAIQHFCWANRKLLQQAGLTYPNLGVKDGAHHRLSPHVPLSLAKTWEFIDPVDWAPQLAAGAVQPILLSSELMSSADGDTVRRTAAILQQHFNVHVLMYVRRIDDSIMADYNQTVKGGVQRLPIEQALPGMFEQLRIDRVVPKWKEAFGAAHVTVRPYDRRQFLGGDILRDFCAQVGIAWSEAFETPAQNPNSRLGRPALEFKRCLNVVIPDTRISVKFNPCLLDYSARHDRTTTAIFAEADLLPGAVRRMLIARQDDYYRELAGEQTGLQGRSLFSSDLPGDDLDWTPLSLTKAEFDLVGQAVLGFRLRQILREQVAEARASKLPQRLLYAARFADLI